MVLLNALQFKKKINVVSKVKKYLYNIIFLSQLLVGLNSFAQKHPILDNFDVFEVSGKVYINCVISSGYTCNGIDVLRSEDNLTFQSVGHIGGVCGSSSDPVSYNFTDDNPPKNKLLYYKLELGGYGFTDVLTINIIDTKEFGFQIRPNPANQNTTIYFENKYDEEYHLVLMNIMGKVVLSQITRSNFFRIDLSNIPSGIYFFNILDLPSQQTSGKLIVRH